MAAAPTGGAPIAAGCRGARSPRAPRPGPDRATAALARQVDPRTISRWLAAGRLVRLHPCWVTLPEPVHDWTVRAHAATGFTGGLLSHVSALIAHGVVDRELTRLHVSVPAAQRIRSAGWLRVHRSQRPTATVIARGLPVTGVARSLADTWDLAHGAGSERGMAGVAREAVFRATRDQRATVPQLEAELAAAPSLAGRAVLAHLLAQVREGARSHLEILGLQAIVATAGRPRPLLQHRVLLPDGPVDLDAAWPEVRLAVEFDGAAFHTDPVARRRDLRRDAAGAAAMSPRGHDGR